MVQEEDGKKTLLKGLIKEGISFGAVYIVFAGIISLIFYFIFGLDWLFENYRFYILYILFPLVLGVFFFWIIKIKKRSVKEFLRFKPKLPEKGHRWFYSILFILILLFIISEIFLLWVGLSYFSPPTLEI